MFLFFSYVIFHDTCHLNMTFNNKKINKINSTNSENKYCKIVIYYLYDNFHYYDNKTYLF